MEPDASRDRLLEPILGVARPQDVLGVDRVKRSEELVDDGQLSRRLWATWRQNGDTSRTA